MRLIDADWLSEAIHDNVHAPYEEAVWAKEDCLAEIEAAQTVDAVPVVRCRECKNYVIVDEFEGGKRYMCLVNHFSYLDNDGDNQFCSYGEKKEGADNGS